MQEGRKGAGFEITDRIIVNWNANSQVIEAVLENMEHIKREVLAVDMHQDQSLLTDTELGFTFNLKKS